MALPGTPGQRISDLCNGRHIPQKELAKKIGISPSQLRWHAPRTSGHFVPKWLVAVLPLPGYSFSDGHSFFKVQLIDELP